MEKTGLTEVDGSLDTEFQTIIANDESVPCSVRKFDNEIHAFVAEPCDKPATIRWVQGCGCVRLSCSQHLLEWASVSFPCRDCREVTTIVDFHSL